MSGKKLSPPNPGLAGMVKDAIGALRKVEDALSQPDAEAVTPKYPLHWTLEPDGGWIKGSAKYPQSFADYFHPQRAYEHMFVKPASATEWWKPPTVDEAIARVRAMAAKKGIEGLAEWLPSAAPPQAEPSPPRAAATLDTTDPLMAAAERTRELRERVTPATHDNIPSDWVNEYGLTLAQQNVVGREDDLEYGPPAARPGVAH